MKETSIGPLGKFRLRFTSNMPSLPAVKISRWGAMSLNPICKMREPQSLPFSHGILHFSRRLLEVSHATELQTCFPGLISSQLLPQRSARRPNAGSRQLVAVGQPFQTAARGLVLVLKR